MSDEPRWVPGSSYRVRSQSNGEEPLETRGTFEGFLPVSDTHMIVMRLDDSHDETGSRRFIPVDRVLAVDVVEMAEPEPDDEDPLYYS